MEENNKDKENEIKNGSRDIKRSKSNNKNSNRDINVVII